MTRQKNRHRRDDHYYRLAKREGYRSRSAYKLLQIAERFDLIRPGDVVLDLGCSPGGWVQVSSQLVGDQGYVLGVDKRPVEELREKNVKIISADVKKPETIELITKELPRKTDVILSDLSPDVTGNWQIDHLKQIELATFALSVAEKLLKHNGRFMTKAFQGEKLDQFIEELRERFSSVRIFRPPATRKRSAEVYLFANRFLGG
ncbi:MAG: RlmE family RNA methyltransferase [Candidatus Bathyarchaeota archaeon]|nr:MAG: RlmE family RNA methyltransferase [Candidatus Bathyarchaeota archaeon]